TRFFILSLGMATGAGVLAHRALAGRATDLQKEEETKMSTEPVRPPLVAKNGVESRPAESRENGNDLLVVRNRVVDPDGKPVAEAKVYLVEILGPFDFPAKEMPPQVRAVSAADGRFDFAVPKRDVHLPGHYVNPWQHVAVLAVAEGYGPAWGPAIAPE